VHNRTMSGGGSFPPEQEDIRILSGGTYWEEGLPPERRPSVFLSPDAGTPVGEPFPPIMNRDSLVRWVMRNNPLLTETRARLCNELPMPAGRGALDEWARIWDELMRPEHPSLCPEELGDISEGLPPDTYLGLALERRKLHGSVWLLGPMQPFAADEDGGDFWQFVDPVLQTTELPGGGTAIRQLGTALRKWYGSVLLGQKLYVGGRPLGSRSPGPPEDERTAYDQACRALSPEDRTPSPIAIRMGAILGREIRPQRVDYWQKQGDFPKDPQARRRRRRPGLSRITDDSSYLG